ncbi:MAG: ribosome small subunit-dependent GTPase A [Deltaproteobacteria bacterium]|nr:ribosome small subunit-dependent GTPase A [Deltaproteobacteria bacterium]
MFDLSSLGLSSFFSQQLDEHACVARVSAVHRGEVELIAERGRLRARCPDAVVGDWVALEGERVERVLNRRTLLSRKTPGRSSDAQVLAANVDVVWVVTAVGPDLSLARLERYLALAWDGGASPVVVVNKIDRGPDAGIDEIEAAVPVHRISASDGAGVADLVTSVEPGQTVVMLGSSGVGKSTLLNRLTGASAETREVRTADDTGRHTTTRREMYVLPRFIVIDTPGLREVGLWAGKRGIQSVFSEVESLAENCRFRDCAHGDEPGCAVAAEMPPERLERYRALMHEQAAAAERADAHAQKAAGKRMGKMIREAKDWRSKRRGGNT